MNKLRTLRTWSVILFSLIGLGLHAQVVINEISYNPPESGNDTLEYIELINAGNAMVNIGGWHFSAGVEDTFPNVDLHPGDYFVTAISASAMMNVFGIAVHEWTAGALSNNGELIKLVDGGGNLVDSVLYDDVDPWPTEPDGGGPSLELIDLGLDNNDGSNWQFSGGGTGVIINGFEVSGTPGAENSGGGTGGPAVTIEAAHLEFNPKNVVVQLGDLVRWVNNEATPHNVNGSLLEYPANPEGFLSGGAAPGPWEFDHTFNTTGLHNYHCDPHLGSGMTGTVSVYDLLSYTDFPLHHLRLTNENGTHLFDGVPTTVTGVVHGINFQPTGYSFYIINSNNVGINVFSFDPGSYIVAEGDQVKVSGVIDAFNGLLEIIPDDIEILSTGNSLVAPDLVSNVSEETEGSHIALQIASVDSIVATGTSGHNMYITEQSGSKILVRLDIDSGFDLQFAESADFVRGIGTQFDNSFPFTSGYQMLALEFALSPGFPALDKDAIRMTPNPANVNLVFQSDLELKMIQIYSMDGKQLFGKDMKGGNSEINISDLPVGLHFVEVITDEGIWTSLLSVIR